MEQGAAIQLEPPLSRLPFGVQRRRVVVWPDYRDYSRHDDPDARLCATITKSVTSEAGEILAKRQKDIKEIKIERPPRAKLSPEESLKRTQEFDKRREKFIASIRKGKG